MKRVAIIGLYQRQHADVKREFGGRLDLMCVPEHESVARARRAASGADLT